MVREFENRSGFAGWLKLSGAWTTILTDELNQTGRFIVVGEESMREEAMEEQAFVAVGATAQGSKAPTEPRSTPASAGARDSGIVDNRTRRALPGCALRGEDIPANHGYRSVREGRR